jgi:hypothetical protein
MREFALPSVAVRPAVTLNRIEPKEKPRACPSCGQTVKLYRRTIHSTMARQLIAIYRKGGTYRRAWVEVPELIKGMRGAGGGDYAKAAYWSLIEQRPGVREDGSARTGWYRVTIQGEAFVRGLLKAQRFALVFNGQVHGFDGPLVNIRQCLGKKFDYNDLMAGV